MRSLLAVLFFSIFAVRANATCELHRALLSQMRDASVRAERSAWLPTVAFSYRYLPKQSRPVQAAIVPDFPIWGAYGPSDWNDEDGLFSVRDGERHMVLIRLSWDFSDVIASPKIDAARRLERTFMADMRASCGMES